MTSRLELPVGPDQRPRCPWGLSTADYTAYHDAEWGFPVDDDQRLFEKLCLEGFQAGLSWLTILRKRDNFRSAFANFDAEQVARFDESDVARLLGDAGIVRHRGKIEATIGNARAVLELRAEMGSLAAFVWGFAPEGDEAPRAMGDLPATTPGSTALSKALKARGFRFVGPTTVYAFMQAMGMVNDHLEGCCVRAQASAARDAFVIPRTSRPV